MSYKALYRQWRPKNFEEMVGQQHITKVLKHQIENNQTGHAYLFCGTRGTGKTSTAKIFAKGVNCISTDKDKPCGECENCLSIQDEIFMDVIEMDAASNNGVDNIRELRESIKYPPAKGKYKVYIIDEVHMLSTGAFNALLKTLEEPPSYVKFILATTEVHKLPATILSRCQRFDFKRISEQEMADRMKYICDNLNIQIEDAALMLIARNAEGSVRDALSTLDQCIATTDKSITVGEVVDVLGTVDEAFMLELTDAIIQQDTAGAISKINRIVTEGKDIQQFIKDWIFYYRNLLMSKICSDLENIVMMSNENIERLKEQGSKLDMPSISNAIMELSKTSASAKWSSQPRILLELAVVKLSSPEMNTSLDGLLERITLLEKSIQSGNNIYIKETPETAKIQYEKEVITTPKQTETKKEASEIGKEKSMPNPEKKYNNTELQKLWSKIISDARSEKPSLTMLSQGVKLHSMDESSFSVYADSDAKKEYILRNREFIEEVFAKHTSKPLRLKCHTGQGDSINQKNDDDIEIKKELESVFGSDKISIIEE